MVETTENTEIDTKSITEPQTAQIAQLHTEFADHPTRGLTPGKLATIMEDAERGDLLAQCDLFEDMEEKDGHIAAELGKRKRALLGLAWEIVPPRNATAQEENITNLVNEIILDVPDFEDIIFDIADGIGYGFSCLEYSWERKKYWQPKKICHRPPRWFTVKQDDRNHLRLRDSGHIDGVDLWPGGWIQHIHKAKSGDITRAGLHRALAWPFLFKNYAVRDLAEFLEIYGLPIRIGQYPRGATDKEKSTLLSAVTNMGHAAAGIIPDGMMVEFKEAAKGGSDPYTAMMEWCEKNQSKAILGGTLTSQADGASSTNALGNVHNEVRHDLLISDARQIASTLTRDLVGVICKLNGWEGGSTRCPRFAFDTIQSEDMGLFAEAIPKLVNVGVQVPESYVREKLRIPAAQDGDVMLSPETKQEPIQNQEALAQTLPKPKKFTSDQQAVEDLAAAMPMKSPIDTDAIQAAIRAATGPEDLELRLALVMEGADLTEFSRVLEKALFASDVMGFAHG